MTTTITAREEIAQAKFGGFHFKFAVLLTAIMFFDGYDLFNAAYVIPLVRKTWQPSPGMIGFMGTTLGEAKVNIANFQLGREKEGGDAIALLYVDGPVSEEVLEKLRANPAIRQAKLLSFNID